MKINHCFTFLQLAVACVVPCWARGNITNQYNQYQHEIDERVYYAVSASNGLRLAFVSYHKSSPTNTAKQPIQLSFSLPQQLQIVYLPIDECLVRLTLYDTNNAPLPKTALGERYGLKNDLRWDTKLVRQQHGSGEPWGVHDGWSRLAYLPSPDQLFVIRRSGNYRLIMEFQVFLKKGPKKDVVRFPPLEVPIVSSE